MLCLGKSCSIWLSLWLNLVWLCTSEHCLTCAPVFPLGLNKVIKKNLATLKASRATCEGNILVLQSECGFVWSHGQGHRLLRQTNQIQTLFTFYRLQDFGQVAFFTFLQYIMEAVVTLVTSLELGRIQWRSPLRYGAAAAAKSLQLCATLCDPHRRQPTRLPRPWDSPGKNTGVGCHFLLQCMKVKSESEVAQSCLTLRDPMDCSVPGSSVQGIF